MEKDSPCSRLQALGSKRDGSLGCVYWRDNNCPLVSTLNIASSILPRRISDIRNLYASQSKCRSNLDTTKSL